MNMVSCCRNLRLALKINAQSETSDGVERSGVLVLPKISLVEYELTITIYD